MGRATRVWEVVGLHDGLPYVIKDLWLSLLAKGDQATLRAIYASLKAAGYEESEFKDYFMDIVVDEVVTINGEPDAISEEVVSQFSLPHNYMSYFIFQDVVSAKERSIHSHAHSRQEGTPGSRPELLPGESYQSNKLYYYESGQHHRVLFRQRGKRLDDIKNQKEFFRTLRQVVEGTYHYN